MVDQQTTSGTLEDIAEQTRSGQLDEARKALEAIVVTDENRIEVLFLQGYLQEFSYDRIGALATYDELLEQDPDHTETLFRAALLRDLWGEDAEALELYQRCTTGSPAHVNALINLAVLSEDRGLLEEAEAYLDSVLAEKPNHKRAKHFLQSVNASYDMVYDEKSLRDRERYDADLEVPISDFELSVRSRNCLRQMNIRTLGDLLRTTEAELLSYKNFGETSLNEIKAMLVHRELSLGQALQVEEPGPVETTPSAPAEEGTGILSRFISELELSVRARKCIQLLGAVTVGDLVAHSEAELMATKNFGHTSLSEIQRQLAQFGLSLRE